LEQPEQLPEVRSASPTENWMHESIMELLARQVKRTRDSLACVDDEPALSYRELDRRSDNLAARAAKAGNEAWSWPRGVDFSIIWHSRRTNQPKYPCCVQDIWLIEKLAHFDREVIPEGRDFFEDRKADADVAMCSPAFLTS
jgi:Catalase